MKPPMRLPRVKPEHTPHRFDDGSIHIGGGVYGVAAQIRDPRGWAWEALTQMNGSTPIEAIRDSLSSKYPDLGPTGADTVISLLCESGYVEDAAGRSGDGHAFRRRSPHEMKRYMRNLAYFRHIDLRPGAHEATAQCALMDSRIAVLGVGGVGCHAAWALAAAGVGNLHLIDPDTVEESNLTRQVLFDERDLGTPKAKTAARRLAHVNSAGTFTYSPERVDSPEKIREVVGDCDILALCADEPKNDAITRMVNATCAESGTRWVCAGYSGPLSTVGVFGPGGPCYECLGAGESAKLKDEWHPPLGNSGVMSPSAALAGALLANEIIGIVTGTTRQAPGFVRGVNLIAPDHLVYVRHPSRPDCTVCGS